MKIKTLSIILFLATIRVNSFAQIDRVEPPNWWAGMKNPKLQLMIHGDEIAGSSVEIEYDGVNVRSASSLDSRNYLFVDLELEKDIQPGAFSINLIKCDGSIVSLDYSILDREPGSAMREGFNNSDAIYMAMPDRFANGDQSNDIVPGMRESVIDRNNRTGRHGGDLRGIMDHLDYIIHLGFTTLWLNPVLENDMDSVSYHGYSTTDYYKVDPRFGTNEQYRDLCILARENGMKVIMDMVFNHIGIRHWWMKDPPAADWINFYPDYVKCNHRRTVNQDPHAAEIDRQLMVEGWFDATMPDLNGTNPFLATYLIQNSIWWIEYAGLAGIRMDTYPYPDKNLMAEWNRRVLNEYPHFNITGEEWSPDPGLLSYWQLGKQNVDGYQGNLPSLLDFPVQIALSKSLMTPDGWDSGWLKLYETLASDFEYPDPYNLVIFPDNHDMSRFYMQVGMNEELYKLGIIFILTTRGIPQIFYGSEILMTHPGDQHGDIRKDFPGGWPGDPVNAFTGKGLTKDQLEMQQFFKNLLFYRQNNPVLQSGKLIHYAPEKGTYVYGRYNAEKRVMVILNKSEMPMTLDMERFSELTANCRTGTDILSGRTFSLDSELKINGLTGYILELH